MKRNQSIVVDLFQGQVKFIINYLSSHRIRHCYVPGIAVAHFLSSAFYDLSGFLCVLFQLKSQVRCLECGYVSVRFDPFTFLSLPLPMDNSVYVEVIGKLV